MDRPPPEDELRLARDHPCVEKRKEVCPASGIPGDSVKAVGVVEDEGVEAGSAHRRDDRAHPGALRREPYPVAETTSSSSVPTVLTTMELLAMLTTVFPRRPTRLA